MTGETALRRPLQPPGPSSLKARTAERNGWPAPVDWDGLNMDDPACSPDSRDRKRTAREVAYEAELLRSAGASHEQIADRLGMTPRDLQVYLARARRYAAAATPIDYRLLEEAAA